MKICTKCKQKLSFSYFYKSKSKSCGYGSQCKKCDIKRTMESRKKIRPMVKKMVFDFLGGKCVRCGFTDIRALQIDHVNGGGKKELKKNGSGISYYKKILLDKNRKYQLLCANCNWIKRYENEEYK